MFELEKLLRPNIRDLVPYSSARDEFKGKDAIFLDANENPYNPPYNRYPDPLQLELKEKIGKIKGCRPGQIFTGNGSDEAIDLLIRAFCEPGQDNIVTFQPSYGMYEVAAGVNNVKVVKVLLEDDFSLDPEKLLSAYTGQTKLVMLCSPNNPTANCLDRKSLLRVLEQFNGLVVIDEAYIDFCLEQSLLPELDTYPNLVILQTFSKSWGLAGIRLGMAFASEAIIKILNKIKYPYNVNILTQREASAALDRFELQRDWVKQIIKERETLVESLKKLPIVHQVYPSDANFVLVRVSKPVETHKFLVNSNIVVRDRSKVTLCEGCLRITVGNADENKALLDALRQMEPLN